MIDAALLFLATELNEYLVARTGTNFGSAELGRLTEDSGKTSIKEDRLGVALINVSEETALRAHLPQTVNINGMQVALEPELRVNLHVMFAANFRQYVQALRQLSLVLTFFQSHRLFEPDANPALDPRIKKLTVELESLGYEQINQIWSFVGGKQLPSAIFRIRMISLQDLEPISVGQPITTVSSNLHEK